MRELQRVLPLLAKRSRWISRAAATRSRIAVEGSPGVLEEKTQKAFATELEIDPSTLAKWERGERTPTGGFLLRLESALG